MAKVTGYVSNATRLRNTVNGNPRYRLVITDEHGEMHGPFETTPDSSLAGRITNTEFKVREHTFAVNGRGHLSLLTERK